VLAIGWLERHPTLSATLVLILALHVCFFPFIWGDKTLLAASRGTVPAILPNGAGYGGAQGPDVFRGNDMGASGWLTEPDAPLVRHEYLQEKHLPLWNPYQSYGAPLAANMQSQPFSPLFVLYSLGPGPRTYNLFVLVRLLIAGLCAYLYLRLFVGFAAALAGGIACMLSGYFILFFNMPHVSVEMLIPAVFLAAERLLRETTRGNVALCAAVTFLCVVGGMPESAFLALVFGTGYFLFRLWFMRTEAVKRLTFFVLAQAIGLALAGFLLAPFVEFMRLSFDTHQPGNLHGAILGLRHDPWGLSAFTYLVPLLFGTAWNPVAAGVGGYDSLRGFMGVVQILFAVVAIAGWRRETKGFPHSFFLAAAAVLVLKRYGAPVVNWIGLLPFCQLVHFPKYEEPLLTFSVAALCAFGIDQVLRGGVSRRRLAGSALVVFALLVVAAGSWPHADYGSLAGAFSVLFLAMLLLLRPGKPWIPAALLALLLAEMAGDYIYPVYYFRTVSAGDDANPYRGAPYIDYLQRRLTAHERVFGRQGVLHPDWAGSFQLSDIRGLDAMYYRKYFDFIRFFLRDDIPPGDRGDLVNRFTGMRWPAFDDPLKQRLLELSSVRFLLSPDPYMPGAERIREIVRQNAGRLLPGKENLVDVRTFTIAGETEPVLFEHPPYERLPYRTAITPATRELEFDIAMQPAVYDGSMPVCGDGVEFRLEARNAGGDIRQLYDRYIDPKHNPAERRWISGAVDLSAYSGQTVDLLFTTTPGPAGDTCADWAGWGDPHFSGDTSGQPAFRLVYDRGVKIYEYADTLPRAALFSHVESAADEREALERLASPSLDTFTTAVVSAKGLAAADAAAIAELNRTIPERVRAARIVSYSSQEVTIDAATDRPALLVLNDSDYPGWQVYVDGGRWHWITANYLFRGVLLRPGRHLVRFAYEPASFRAGAAISGAALLALAALAVRRLRIAKPDLVH